MKKNVTGKEGFNNLMMMKIRHRNNEEQNANAKKTIN